ncbi:hypothetical protein ACJX0J_006437, partial [Zea mays]
PHMLGCLVFDTFFVILSFLVLFCLVILLIVLAHGGIQTQLKYFSECGNKNKWKCHFSEWEIQSDRSRMGFTSFDTSKVREVEKILLLDYLVSAWTI